MSDARKKVIDLVAQHLRDAETWTRTEDYHDHLAEHVVELIEGAVRIAVSAPSPVDAPTRDEVYAQIKQLREAKMVGDMTASAGATGDTP